MNCERASAALTLSDLLDGDLLCEMDLDPAEHVDASIVSLTDELSRYGQRLGVLPPNQTTASSEYEEEENVVEAQEGPDDIVENAELMMQGVTKRPGQSKKTTSHTSTGNNNGKKKERLQERRAEVANRPAPNKPKTVCKYYLEGLCSKGESCPFSHAAKPRRTAAEAKSSEVCRFFMTGGCLKGDSCIYSHDLKRVPCRFFQIAPAACSNGKACRFSHDPLLLMTDRQP